MPADQAEHVRKLAALRSDAGVHVHSAWRSVRKSLAFSNWMSTKAVFRDLLLNQDKIPAIRWNDALGVIHNSWSIVPWGLPEARKIPSGSVLASSVGMRQQYEPNYTPRNLDERMSLMQFVKVI